MPGLQGVGRACVVGQRCLVRTRCYLQALSPTGQLLALLAYCVAARPAILPQPWYLTAIVAGLSAALAYALGAAVGALCRRGAPHGQNRRRRLPGLPRRGPVLLAALLLPTSALATARAQSQLSAMVGVRAPGSRPLLTLLLASGLALSLLVTGRGLRRVIRSLASLAPTGVPFPAARFAAGGLVLALVLVSGDQVIERTALPYVNQLADRTNDGTPAGVHRPRSPLRSGSPASLISWGSLGREGRVFVAGGPDRARIRAVTGAPARSPVRVFTGTGSASGVRQRIRLAVRELERTGAFRCRALAVVGTTGSGWVDPALTDTVEYLYQGDTAEVAVQYSHLPSWLSFLTDRRGAVDVQCRLLSAVRTHISALPPARRPRLLLLGESLGAYAGEAAAGSVATVLHEVDGALFVGSPASAPLSQRLREQVADGAPLPAGVAIADGTRALPARSERVVFVQHDNDPIVRWSPELIWRRPRTPDLPGAQRLDGTWLPVVSFLQDTAAVVRSRDVRAGAGHVYGPELVDALAALGAPAGWGPVRATAVRAAVAADTGATDAAGS